MSVPWAPGYPTPSTPAVTGVHAAGTVPTCPTCQAQREAEQPHYPDDDEPFGYPPGADQPDDDGLEVEPPITLEPEIVPQVFE